MMELDKNNEALQLLTNARNYISDFCINECGAYCCKNGKLLLQTSTERDMLLKTQKSVQKALKKGILAIQDTGNYHYDLQKLPCKNFDKKTALCKIHNNKPKICTDYPLFLVQDYIVTSGICPAVKNGKLNPHLKQLEDLGYKII